MNKRRWTLAIAVILIVVGVLLFATDVIESSVERRAVAFDGPMDVQGQTLMLRETRGISGLNVDLVWGQDTIVTGLSVTPDARANLTDYAERYAGALWLYAPNPPSLPWHLVVVDRSDAEPQYARYVLNAAAPTQTQPVSGDLAKMREDFNLEVLRRPSRKGLQLPLPPPALVLAGALLLIWRPGPRVSSAPTLSLVFGMAALSSLVAWPVMMHLGPTRSLPPALLALGTTLLVALGFATRWQSAFAAKATFGRIVRGNVYALILLAVFTVVWVQINGFMAPIFRAPGAGLSPGEWFVRDMVAPSLAVSGLGLIPALVSGTLYGAFQRGD